MTHGTYGLEVGAIVCAPDNPDWGEGQIQSMVGDRITVNFQNHGKTVLIGGTVTLELIEADTL